MEIIGWAKTLSETNTLAYFVLWTLTKKNESKIESRPAWSEFETVQPRFGGKPRQFFNKDAAGNV
jgi:hypothetical protein